MHPDPFYSHLRDLRGASSRDYAECGVIVSEHGETLDKDPNVLHPSILLFECSTPLKACIAGSAQRP